MSYQKAMKWNRKHPKGTRQPVLMHTDSGFTPSNAFLDKYFKYQAECEKIGIKPESCEYYYHNTRECNNLLKTKLTNERPYTHTNLMCTSYKHGSYNNSRKP